MENNFWDMEKILDRLSIINKDELSDREFFYAVLSVVKNMKDLELTEEDFEKFSDKLSQIGCVDEKTWLQEVIDLGVEKELRHPSIKDGCKEGSIEVGARLVGFCMSDYNSAKTRIKMMTEKGEKSGLVQMWLRNNEKIFTSPNPNNRDAELEYQINLKREERQLESQPETAEQLRKQISSLQQEIDELQVQTTTLINSKIRKQLELNDLEEK